MSANARIAELLDEVARLMELVGEDSFRVSAHTRAARAVADFAGDVASMSRADLQKIPGVGPKIAEKIEQFGQTGRIAERDELLARVPAGLLKLLEIPGVGPKTVRAMWHDLKITDLAGLERAIADGSILTLPRMGEKAVEKIKASIAFVKSGPSRLWLGKAADVAERFAARLRGVPGVAEVSPAGSLRRGKDTIGDIDILVAMKPGHEHDAARVGEAFTSSPGVMQVLAGGGATTDAGAKPDHVGSKWSVRAAIDADHGRWGTAAAAEGGGPSVQVDLRVVPLAAWGSALMYFTGSKEHNVRLRERALKLGLTLNEWGLFPLGPSSGPSADPTATPRAAPRTNPRATPRTAKRAASGAEDAAPVPVAAATEEAVFAALGLHWIPPEMREDRGEIAAFERASPGPTPRVVAVEDIASELHAHTTASDGTMSIEELATAARARGFHTIAVTDHSRSSVQANGLSPERLERHIEAVRKAGETIKGITILAGSEVDILADGSLDYDDDLLGRLDIVVASPHAALSQDPAVATARLLRAIAHPMVQVLGHPTGRLINRRPGLSPDVAALVAAAKQHNTALEINAHWMRLDLRDTHVRQAVDAGCLIAIDTDAHEPGDFDNLRFGVMTARRGWCPPELCVNAWSADRLRAWLRSKRPDRRPAR